MPTPSPFGPSSPESILAAWLERADREEDIGELCVEHPEHARRLRELHAYLVQVEPLLRLRRLGGSVAERLQARYGHAVDPAVTLSLEEGAAPSRPSSGAPNEVLERLAGRGASAGRYRFEGEVAHGGMGAILGVWDQDLRRHLAMKVMLGKGAGEGTGDTPPADPRMLSRFLEEAQVTGQLDHPGIVPVHELGLDAQGRVFFTMKLVKGRTLKEVLDDVAAGEGGWTESRALGVLLKVCEAMSYAHAKGVLHRDLKPANVMVGRFGEVYVMDWGLARVLGRDDEKDLRIRPRSDAEPGRTSEVLSDRKDRAAEGTDSPLYTMDGDVVGTPAYMPPEQARGELARMGPHSDVYSLGAILYHLIARHAPYLPPRVKANNYAVWQLVQQGPPQPLRARARGAPAQLVAICEKAMARDPGDRYADVQQFAEDLRGFLENGPVRAYQTSIRRHVARYWQRMNPLAKTGTLLTYGSYAVFFLIANAELDRPYIGAVLMATLVLGLIGVLTLLASLFVPGRPRGVIFVAALPILFLLTDVIGPCVSAELR